MPKEQRSKVKLAQKAEEDSNALAEARQRREEAGKEYEARRAAPSNIRQSYQTSWPSLWGENPNRRAAFDFMDAVVSAVPKDTFTSGKLGRLQIAGRELPNRSKIILGSMIYAAQKVEQEYKSGWNSVPIVNWFTSWFLSTQNSQLYRGILGQLNVASLDELAPETKLEALMALHSFLVNQPGKRSVGADKDIKPAFIAGLSGLISDLRESLRNSKEQTTQSVAASVTAR